MQEIVVKTYCDYPGCADAWKAEAEDNSGQPTTRTTVWVYAHARGRKTAPVEVLLCDKHVNELRDVFQALQKYNLKDSD